MSLEPGERVLLLGPSGAGKSTLLAGLAGVLGGADEGEEEGTIRVDGGHPRERRGRVGMVLQDPDSQVVMPRVGDDVAFGCENVGLPREQIWSRVTEALDDVGLQVGLDHPSEKLSGGQRQRLVLAGVLAMRPGLLLLDEPTANVDPAGAREIRDAIISVADAHGLTLLVVEHHTDLWADDVDRVVVLEPGGGVALDGPPSEIFGAHAARLHAMGVWTPDDPTPPPLPPSPTAEPILSAEGLTIGWEKRALRGFEHVAIERGRSTAITGPNGSGKSTLALTLAGLLPPVAGQVRAAADLVPPRRRPDPSRWRSTELLARIGTVFQNPEHQFVAATVADELRVGLRALAVGPADADARIEAMLERLRLTALAKANPFTLSGGEKRRLSVATVLVTAPELIFLDEPTFGQDRLTWMELVALVRDLRQEGHTIVSITHDEPFVAALGERRLALTAPQREAR